MFHKLESKRKIIQYVEIAIYDFSQMESGKYAKWNAENAWHVFPQTTINAHYQYWPQYSFILNCCQVNMGDMLKITQFLDYINSKISLLLRKAFLLIYMLLEDLSKIACPLTPFPPFFSSK